MFRHEYCAEVSYVQTIDATCPNCGGIFHMRKTSTCPDCHAALVHPTRQTEDGIVPYGFTEVTLEPILTAKDRNEFLNRVKQSKRSSVYLIRMIIWCRYDKDTNTLYPDNRVKYITPHRLIRVTFNTPPTLIPFHSSVKGPSIEIKYVLNGYKKDQLEFLDSKKAAEALLVPNEPTPESQSVNNQPAVVSQPATVNQPAVVSDNIADKIAHLEARINQLTNAMTVPAQPAAKEVSVSAIDALVPDGELVAPDYYDEDINPF